MTSVKQGSVRIESKLSGLYLELFRTFASAFVDTKEVSGTASMTATPSQSVVEYKNDVFTITVLPTSFDLLAVFRNCRPIDFDRAWTELCKCKAIFNEVKIASLRFDMGTRRAVHLMCIVSSKSPNAARSSLSSAASAPAASKSKKAASSDEWVDDCIDSSDHSAWLRISIDKNMRPKTRQPQTIHSQSQLSHRTALDEFVDSILSNDTGSDSTSSTTTAKHRKTEEKEDETTASVADDALASAQTVHCALLGHRRSDTTTDRFASLVATAMYPLTMLASGFGSATDAIRRSSHARKIKSAVNSSTTDLAAKTLDVATKAPTRATEVASEAIRMKSNGVLRLTRALKRLHGTLTPKDVEILVQTDGAGTRYTVTASGYLYVTAEDIFAIKDAFQLILKPLSWTTVVDPYNTFLQFIIELSPTNTALKQA